MTVRLAVSVCCPASNTLHSLDLLEVLWGIVIIGIVGQDFQFIARSVVLHTDDVN
jgi:hypothetical protein